MKKNKIPKKFRLPFSKGVEWVEQFLQNHAKKLPSSEAFCVSKKLHKQILKLNQDVESSGLPPHLHLAYVHPQVKTGVFLKPQESSIKAGSLIGVYTGTYELVPENLSIHTSYSYDVATNVCIPKEGLQHVQYSEKSPTQKEEYSIQTNAFAKGNFTRFINHSSLQPNIEAVVSKFPEGRIEIILFALKEIKPGEQLLSNYGGQYWKALNIIPSDMIATTYQLNDLGKAKLVCKIKGISKPALEKLKSLRNGLPTATKTQETFIEKHCKKKLPALSKKQQDLVEKFEEIALEQGIPRNFEWTSCLSQLRLKKTEQALAKNTFIGVMAGTYTFTKTASTLALAATKEKTLFLNPLKDGNSFGLCPRSPQGNIQIKLFYDKERNITLPLLYSTKKILPGDKLILVPPTIQHL